MDNKKINFIPNKTHFLLDSGDPEEYDEIGKLAKVRGSEIWGSTTNPSLIAKKLSSENKRLTTKEAFKLQKQIVMQIVKIVPGPVSAEVYADHTTSSKNMIKQGQEISTWHERVVVKLPTTIEGFKARTELRKKGICTNNTLVFSQQQIFAICLHEQLIQKKYGPTNNIYPPFISPFVGRLDDIGQNGMQLVDNGMQIKEHFKTYLSKLPFSIWMLEASVRSIDHIKLGILAKSELITAPAKLYKEWFALSNKEQESAPDKINSTLRELEYWQAPNEINGIDSLDKLFEAITTNRLNVLHELTNQGIDKFVADWKNILS